MNSKYLTDIIEVKFLQKIQDSFSDLAGLAALTADKDGRAVTKGSNFTDYCMKLMRTNDVGCRRCEECDKMGAVRTMETGTVTTYYCHSGLVDFAAPIKVNGEMIGSFIGGQVLPEPPKKERIYKVADELGIDRDTLWEAALKVPVRPKEEIDECAKALFRIAEVLSEMAYAKYLAEKSKEDIEYAAKMKSDFLANMSHEIRTPMNAVIGMSEMALREELSPEAREYINQIKSSGRALLNIINDILDFSKIESGKMNISPVEYEPLSIVNDVSNILLVRLQDKDIELILDVNPEIPALIEGDNLRIKQVLTNLANNAIKFTKKGYVKIRADYEKTGDDTINLLFDVEDTGIGIRSKDKEKLFISFNQVDTKRNRNIEGTGLGLAISKNLVELMDGELTFDSTYGKGSVFSFYVPQNVIDHRSIVNIDETIEFVCLYHFDNSSLEEQFLRDMSRLHIKCKRIEQWSEAEEEFNNAGNAAEEERFFIFSEIGCLDGALEKLLSQKPSIKCVMFEGFFANGRSHMPNLKIVKTPITPIKISLALRGEEFITGTIEEEAFDIDYVAPDAKILLVDDNAINLTVAEGLLEPSKIQITPVTSGKEALMQIENTMFDMILMDHMMPDLDGVETTKLIRGFHPDYKDVPILALTANAIEGTREMFLESGMNDVIPKPIELKTMALKVRKWLPQEKILKKSEIPSEGEEAVSKADTDLMIGDLDIKGATTLLGNEKLFMKILGEYYSTIPAKEREIKLSLDTMNIHEYTIQVHALKSSSRQIGANELADMAAKMELAGNHNDIDSILENSDTMLDKYHSYIDILAPWFEKEESEEEKAEKTEADNETLIALFGQLKEASEELDMDGMEQVGEELKKYEFKGAEKDLYTEILDAIEAIDSEECLSIMDKWRAERGIQE